MSTGTIKVPDVTGKTEAEARSVLTDAGFSDGQIRQPSVESDDGRPRAPSSAPTRGPAAPVGRR